MGHPVRNIICNKGEFYTTVEWMRIPHFNQHGKHVEVYKLTAIFRR